MRTVAKLILVFAAPAMLGWLLTALGDRVYSLCHLPGYFGFGTNADPGGAQDLVVCLVIQSVIVSALSLKSLRWGCVGAAVLFLFPPLLIALLSGLVLSTENHRNFLSFMLIVGYSAAFLGSSAFLVRTLADFIDGCRGDGQGFVKTGDKLLFRWIGIAAVGGLVLALAGIGLFRHSPAFEPNTEGSADWGARFTDDIGSGVDLFRAGDKPGAKAKFESARDDCLDALKLDPNDHEKLSLLAASYGYIRATDLGGAAHADAAMELNYALKALAVAPDKYKKVDDLREIITAYAVLDNRDMAEKYQAEADKIDPSRDPSFSAPP